VQTAGDAEGPLELADVLPEQHDRRIALHLLDERGVERVEVGDLAGRERLGGRAGERRHRGRRVLGGVAGRRFGGRFDLGPRPLRHHGLFEVDAAPSAGPRLGQHRKTVDLGVDRAQRGRGIRVRRLERLVDRGLDQSLRPRVDRGALLRAELPALLEAAGIARHRILSLVERELVGGHDLHRAVPFGVAAQASDHRLDQRRPLAGAGAGDGDLDRLGDRVGVVAVDRLGGDAVAGAAVGELEAGVLVASRRREGVAVVLDHQHQRQLPDRGEVHRLVEVAGRRPAFADEVDRDPVGAVARQRERTAGRHRDHRAEVADHADVQDAVLGREPAVVVRALDPLREAALSTQHLTGEPAEQLGRLRPPPVGSAESGLREGARRIEVGREDGADVAMERAEDVYRDRFVADGAVPLRDAAGQQQRLEARVELARELHEGVAADADAFGGHDPVPRRVSLRGRRRARQAEAISARRA